MVDEVLARSFERIGADYDRFRPGFPTAAAELLLPERVENALDLGAGTGKFTELLTDRAGSVIAVEPSATMLDVLRAKLPGVRSLEGSAERIPIGDQSVDVVAVAQAFHWFDRDAACSEIRRVLVPGGRLGLFWNHYDPACAWDRAAQRIAHPAVDDADPAASTTPDALPGFVFLQNLELRWRETITRDDYLSRWGTVSSFIVADDSTRAGMIAAIERVLDEHPATRGRAEFELPQVTSAFIYRRA